MKHPHYKYEISGDITDIISRLGADVHFFNNKKILITGGTGFFGRWLLQALCSLISELNFNLDIYVLSRNPNGFLNKNKDFPFKKYIRFIKGDICDFHLPEIEIDYLVHMATTSAQETFSAEDQLNKIELLFKGTKNTLENAIRCNVKKVLFTSSGVVYGPSEGASKFLESDLRAPKTTSLTSALGEGKRLAEYLISYYSDRGNYQYSIARCFSFAGQYLPLDLHYALGNFINDALNNPAIVVRGSGKELRSYLYIGDAIVWLLIMLIKSDNEIYNVGSSKEISIKQVAQMVGMLSVMKKQPKIMNSIMKEGNFARNNYVPDNAKIIKSLNVAEWTSLDLIIQKMLQVQAI